MAIAYVNLANGYNAASGSSIAAGAQNHTAGNLLVVMVSAWDNATGAVSSISDTAGNTFVKAVDSDKITAEDGYTEIWYAKNISGNASNVVTANFNGAHTYRQITVHQYSGAHLTDPLDQTGENTGTGTSLSTPASSLNHNDQIIVAFYGMYNSGTCTAGSGFTLRNDLTYAGSEDRSIGQKGSYGSAMTYSVSTDWTGCHATFRRAPETKTWDGGGGDNNFSTHNNWNANVAPNEDDSLTFAGTTRLSPNNDYTAGTEFNDITFSSGAGAFTVGGNQFELVGDITNNDGDKQTISCPIILPSGDNYVYVTSGDVALSGVLSGTGHIRISGANVLELSATNTYSGNTKAFSGTISGIGDTSCFGTGTCIMNGGTLQVKHNGSGDDGTITFSNNLLINSANTGTLDVRNNGSNTGNTVVFPFINHGKSTMNYTGANGYKIKITDYSLRGGGAGGTATINPTTAPLITDTFNQSSVNNHTALLSGSNSDNHIQSTVSDGGGGSLQITCNTTGKWRIGNSGVTNTYSGTTTITAGELEVYDQVTTGLGSGGVTMSGGTLRLQRVTLSNAMTVSSASKLIMDNGFGSTYSGNITLNADLEVESWYQPGSDQQITGDISGTGDLTITLGSANSDLKFTGNNTYSGATSVTDVKLVAGAATALSASSAYSLAGTAQLYLDSVSCTIGSLSGSAGTSVYLAGNQVSRLTIGDDDTDTTFAGTIDDGGSGAEGGIGKIGSGKLILSGTNTYWWNTDHDEGTLIIDGSQHANDEVNVASGATIGGSGTINGDLNIANGGILSPGDASAATLTVAAVGGHDLVLSGTSVLEFTLGTVSDQVQVGPAAPTSGLTLDGTINITAGAGFAAGTYIIFTYPTGQLTDNGLSIGTVPAGYKATVDVSEAGKVKIIIGFLSGRERGIGDGIMRGVARGVS